MVAGSTSFFQNGSDVAVRSRKHLKVHSRITLNIVVEHLLFRSSTESVLSQQVQDAVVALDFGSHVGSTGVATSPDPATVVTID